MQSSYLHSRIHGLTVFFVANFLTLPLIDFHSFTLYLFVSSTLALLINFFVYLGFSRYKIRLRKRDCLRVFKYTKDEFANILKRTTITKLYPILEVAVVNTINPLYMSIYGFSKSVISGISDFEKKGFSSVVKSKSLNLSSTGNYYDLKKYLLLSDKKLQILSALAFVLSLMFLLFFPLYSSFIPQLNLEINTSKSILITLIILLPSNYAAVSNIYVAIGQNLDRQAYYSTLISIVCLVSCVLIFGAYLKVQLLVPFCFSLLHFSNILLIKSSTLRRLNY